MRKPSKQPRIKGRFAAKPDRNEEILQGVLDRLHGIESTLSKVESSLAVIRSGASFMEELEKEAPNRPGELDYAAMRAVVGEAMSRAKGDASWYVDKPHEERVALLALGVAVEAGYLGDRSTPIPDAPTGLQPGDYCDASKEVADELTAMGWPWFMGEWNGERFIVMGEIHPQMVAINYNPCNGIRAHLDQTTFLSSARVTAKELGLKWEPKVGDWVVITGKSTIDKERCPIGSVHKISDTEYGPTIGDWLYPSQNLRPATAEEIAAHLKYEERAKKAEALKFGVRVMTPRGEGLYHYEEKGCPLPHRIALIAFHDGWESFDIDEITILP